MTGVLKKTQVFIEECWEELRKVTWPDRDQLRSATIVIILFVIGVSAVIWMMDLVVRTLIDFIMGLFGA